MASTTEATRLTELHRRGQTRINQATVDLMSRSWRLVDSTNLDGSFPHWLRVSETIIRSQAAQSARLSAGYYSAFRSLELGEPLPVDPVVDLTSDTIAANMRVTGPGAVKRAMRTSPVDRAMEIGRSMSARSAARLALSGGRGTIEAAIASDRECIGYARATGGVACAYCARLAARGVIWNTRDDASFKAHDGCVVPGTLVDGPSVEVGYRRRYKGELVIIGLAGGEELAITGNHPVLTDRGWVPANLLGESDNVVRRSGADLRDLRVPHKHEMRSPIEDVWRALTVNGLRSVPVAAEHFHGDGAAGEGDVDVVAADGFLSQMFDSPVGELGAQAIGSHTGPSSIARALSSLRYSLTELLGLGLAPNGGMGGGQVVGDLFGSQRLAMDVGCPFHGAPFNPGGFEPALDGGSRHPESISDRLFGFASKVGAGNVVGHRDAVAARVPSAVTRFDPATDERDSQGFLVHAERGRDLLERLSGGVALGRIRHLRRVEYSGHVLNLQTAEGWYDANSVVVSNCNCTPEPVYSDRPELPPGSEQYRKLWDDVTGDLVGKDALNAFRRALAAR